MSFNDEKKTIAIQVKGVGKSYRIFKKNNHRLYQFFLGDKYKLYNEFWAVRNISFDIQKGDTVAILGRNGAGKSTLLQMICKTLSPTEGTIHHAGKIAALLELGAGFNNEFTGRENIYISGAIYGLSRSEIDRKFPEIERFADIGSFIDQPVKNYSSGMFVRLAFALIVNVDAEILVIDEALAVGDVFFQQKCMRFLRNFQSQGGTILFVSHDTSAVMALCDKAIMLRRDESGDTITIKGDAEYVCQEYLRELYSDPERIKNNILEENNNETHHSIEHAKIFNGEMIDNSLYYCSEFNVKAHSFGHGGGKITYAYFHDSEQNKITSIKSGDSVTLCISVEAFKDIENPAVGIILKDSKGQFIFTESTDPHFRTVDNSLTKGSKANIYFKFTFPVLIRGVYSLDIAFANGIGDDHYQIQWIYDALALECVKGRQVHGILGFDSLKINWEMK